MKVFSFIFIIFLALVCAYLFTNVFIVLLLRVQDVFRETSFLWFLPFLIVASVVISFRLK